MSWQQNERDVKRRVDHWETVAVTALPPGYVNVYTHGDDPSSEMPCPALLIQEHRETILVWDVEVEVDGELRARIQTRTELEDPPYTTRVVFAEQTEDGYLEPANATSNYDFTRAPGQVQQ